MAATPGQVIILNEINTPLNQRLHLVLRGYRIVEFSHSDDVINWLENCKANNQRIAAVIVLGSEIVPFVQRFVTVDIPLFIVRDDSGFDRDLEQELKEISVNENVIFCRNGEQLEAVLMELG
nr:hypothetical protein [uncultured Desulfuromonas sp.]